MATVGAGPPSPAVFADTVGWCSRMALTPASQRSRLEPVLLHVAVRAATLKAHPKLMLVSGQAMRHSR